MYSSAVNNFTCAHLCNDDQPCICVGLTLLLQVFTSKRIILRTCKYLNTVYMCINFVNKCNYSLLYLNLLYQCIFHLACYEHNFAIRVVHCWNALPNFIMQSISLNSFYNHLINFDFSRFLKGRAINGP